MIKEAQQCIAMRLKQKREPVVDLMKYLRHCYPLHEAQIQRGEYSAIRDINLS